MDTTYVVMGYWELGIPQPIMRHLWENGDECYKLSKKLWTRIIE